MNGSVFRAHAGGCASDVRHLLNVTSLQGAYSTFSICQFRNCLCEYGMLDMPDFKKYYIGERWRLCEEVSGEKM